MKHLSLFRFLPIVTLMVGSIAVYGQTTISGTIKDKGTGETLAGFNIGVRGTIAGTISDSNGKFNLKLNQSPPVTLTISFVGYKTQDVEIKDAETTLDISMEEGVILTEVVVSAPSRLEERILKSPVTIEKMDILTIKQGASPDFYDGLAIVKGVTVTNSSLNFTAVNTRGFATISNVRFVQWVDGMDTQAPILNFPTGSIMGLNELDAESIELVPGAASALYGPNAFNGIMIMQSKSPFKYQGLSMQVKQGITKSNAGGSHPLGLYTIRYAKAFNNKFAFKVNFSWLNATDWLSNDYRTDRLNPESKTDQSSNTNFDGLNLYGDETQIPLGAATGIPSLGVVTRTGFKEEDILDHRRANTTKADAALHYKISDKVEASYQYRYGGGNSIYQGSEKYALRAFNQQFHKIEFRGDNFFVRGYLSATDAGKSYNLSALGGYANETYSPSAAPGWVQDYILAMQGYIPGVPAGNPAAARDVADNHPTNPSVSKPRPVPGTQDFTDLMNAVRANYFQQKTTTGSWKGLPIAGGSSFKDNSKIWHAEFNYNFKQIKWAEVMVGGNFRQYSLFTHGTVLNEAPDVFHPGPDDFKRIFINQVGVYTQIAKTLADVLKLTGSIRYDKSDNFEGRFTPRISAVYSINDNHSIRASFQTGFRIPDTQAQFIYFPSSTGILLGTTKANAERYGVLNGLAYSQSSYNNFLASGGAADPKSSSGTATTNGATLGGNPALLQTVNIPYVKPEQLQAYEIGYRGLFSTNMSVDLNYYYSSYTGFIGSQVIASKNFTMHQGDTVYAGTLWAPSVNATEKVTSQGFGAGLTYSLFPSGYSINGNYNWAIYSANESTDFRAGFNTPRNRYSVGLSNRKVTKNIGFNVNFRYQDKFHWVSSYGEWDVPAFGVIDAQVSYKLAPIKTVIKIGGTNIGGGDYRTSLGGPFVGQQYYISVTFDESLIK